MLAHYFALKAIFSNTLILIIAMSLSEDLYEGSVFGYRFSQSKISENKGYQMARTDKHYMWKA